ncbi:MAG: lactate racemase domain-containing protein [Pirellulales bacterium]|nr:lactate racemase domain-containing protein [Pirellulales bacterium]
MNVHKAEAISGELGDDAIGQLLDETLESVDQVKTALVIHPDYSRHDFTDRLFGEIYHRLQKKGLQRLDTLNAQGTHRPMSQDELAEKLGIAGQPLGKLGSMFNHAFDQVEKLVELPEIVAEFVEEKTAGQLTTSMPVSANKLVTESYDLILAISGTVPHEAAGFSGGTKIFFPGIAGPEVIGLLHWVAVLIGAPSIMGKADNQARDVINEGAHRIFEAIGDTPVVSLNMVYSEQEGSVVAKGLYAGHGFHGFLEAYQAAAQLSSQLHIVYLDAPQQLVVQQIPAMYDEIWTAGKGSYKLQLPGVLAEGAEIVLYAPHIDQFHSHPKMDEAIRTIGYHGRDRVLEFLEKHPEFDKNVAAHVINLRGHGVLENGIEKHPFEVTLATAIGRSECQAAGLGYRDPKSLDRESIEAAGGLWIEEGGQWLYANRRQTPSV